MLEAYSKAPIFIPVDITKNVVESVVRNILGGSGPGLNDLEDLQAWLLKSREERKIIHASVETFVDWIHNKDLPWAAYHKFMSGHLIALDKQPVVCLVGRGETWRQLFAKCVMRVTRTEATISCQDD